jgi:hypothetical protein
MSTAPDETPDDATQIHQPDPDATRVTGPDPDAPRVGRPADATSLQPPVEDVPRWTARAGVPQPGDPRLRPPVVPPYAEQESYDDPYEGRSWFRPVLIGGLVVLLVAGLSVGLWLIYRATENGQNAPGEVSAPVTTVAPPPSSQAPPSSVPPSSEAPSSSPPPPSSAPPAAVAIPPLRGNSLADATVKLQVLGLNVQVQRVPDESLPAGEVLATQPGEGTSVAPGSTVIVFVAAPREPSPSPTKPSPSPSRR